MSFFQENGKNLILFKNLFVFLQVELTTERNIDMKKLVFFLLTIMMALLSANYSSCSEDADNDGSTEGVSSVDSFYVKYDISFNNVVYNGNATVQGCDVFIHYQDVETVRDSFYYWGYNIGTNKNKTTWEKTCGPFKKGDKVFLHVKNNPLYQDETMWTHRYCISVKKNNEPYVVKAEGISNKSLLVVDGDKIYSGLEYTIDY